MKKLIVMASVLSVFLLGACQQKPAQVDAITSGKPVAATKNLKPGAQVSIASENVIVIAANQLTTSEVMLAAELDDATMTVSVAAGEGLHLSGTLETYDFISNPDGKYPLKVVLFGADPGRYYVNLYATINKNSELSSRSMTLIVQVGDSLPTSELSQKTLNKISNENIISLPAQERITNQ